MNKKDEKSIVEIAEGAIEKFVEDWSRTPYAWESEADVHADLYGRICSALVQNREKFSKQERDNYPFLKYGYKEWGKEKEDAMLFLVETPEGSPKSLSSIRPAIQRSQPTAACETSENSFEFSLTDFSANCLC